MAYSALPTKIASDTITLTNYNNIRDNFIAGVPDIFTTKGDIAVATAADTAARLGVGNDDDILVPDNGETTGLVWQIQPAVRAYNSGNVAFGATTWTTVTLDSERFDTNAMHSTSSNTSRLTVPTNGDGLYLIGGTVSLGTGGSFDGSVGARILLNGATVIAEAYRDQRGGDDVVITLETLYSLAATDYVEIQVYGAAAGNAEAVGNMSPEFWALWQRRA